MDSPAHDMSPNEYVMLKGDDGESTALARSNGNGTLHSLRSAPPDGVLGIRPLNMHQSFALDALLDDDIKLVTLLGKAGTGKTLLAVAVGLHKVLKEDRYNKLLISRPTMPMGRDIGYLPGDIEEKMRPWMQPIYDAIEMIRDVDRRSRNRSLPPDILDSEEIGIEPLTYIRGRSIPCQYMIIDEAQNLTPLEVKTIITRVGPDTKIILTGDPEQIDNPYVDVMSNGFTYVLHRFRNQAISAHVSLEKGERSSLAEIAANLL
jgi:PhoH-like ATPase